LHLTRREYEHAKSVADESDDDERQSRSEVDPDGHHHCRVLAARAVTRRVVVREVRAVVVQRHCCSSLASTFCLVGLCLIN